MRLAILLGAAATLAMGCTPVRSASVEMGRSVSRDTAHHVIAEDDLRTRPNERRLANAVDARDENDVTRLLAAGASQRELALAFVELVDSDYPLALKHRIGAALLAEDGADASFVLEPDSPAPSTVLTTELSLCGEVGPCDPTFLAMLSAHGGVLSDDDLETLATTSTPSAVAAVASAKLSCTALEEFHRRVTILDAEERRRIATLSKLPTVAGCLTTN